MSKGVRLSETWFNRGLWLIALLFASFLIGLGSLIVGDLPQVEQTLGVEQYVDPAAVAPVRSELNAINKQADAKNGEMERLRLQAVDARNVSAEARQTFDNWLATRNATGLSAQDPELISRTKALDALKAKESELNRQISALDQELLAINQNRDRLSAREGALIDGAQEKLNAQLSKQELRVFLYRLMLTLPLILLAGWLFVKARKSRQWPFVWGFILFALFTFFVELVPYLPSYGGYVRYIVGIVLTVVIGRYVINALQSYLECKRPKSKSPIPNGARN